MAEKAKRKANDFYPTPENVIDNFLNHFKLCEEGMEEKINILEPCAGDGVIIKALMRGGIATLKQLRSEKKKGQRLTILSVMEISPCLIF